MTALPRLMISAFETPLGWFGLLGSEGRLRTIHIGHASQASVIDSLREAAAVESPHIDLADWHPVLKDCLSRYADGEAVDFKDIEPVWLKPVTPFRKKVIAATRRIPRGRVLTYAELAARAGSPGAARAVGNTMATNPFPIVVPCHRVVASGGGLGGFSAPCGIELKRRLLAMEAGED